jgi:RTX toxins and related Ca2+-binding proteins
MAPAGDVNGDGYDDLIIASPTTANDSENTTDGLVFVVFGGGESLWGNTYPATQPFNLGNLTPDVSQLTLYFTTPLNTGNIPPASAFNVTNGLSSVINVTGLAFSNPNELTLTLASDANVSDSLSVAYTVPSSGPVLTYASGAIGTNVAGFLASNDAVIASLGAPTIDIETYTQYGFSITGLPGSQSGISLDGGGDVNGDGFSDFLIGAPGDDDSLAYTLFGSDFNQTVNQTGTIGDDVMVGSPTGESFVAGQGDDLIVTGGGVDVAYAGPGDDQLIVNDLYFQRLDGGAGTDALFFYGYNGQDWDLTTLSPGTRLRDFEVLVTENYGSNTLTLNAISVLQISPTNSITLFMDGTDSLVLSSDFSYSDIVYQYNQNFSQYLSSVTAARVLVNQPNTNSAGTSQVTFSAPSTNSPSSILPSEALAPAASAPSVATAATAVSAPLESTPPSLDHGLGSTSISGQDSITASDAAPGLSTQIFVSNPTVSERTGRAQFTLTRTGDLSAYTWFDYYTQDGDAKAGNRYTPVAGEAVFAPGETTITITVPIPNSAKNVGTRQFGLAVMLEGDSSDPAAVPDAWRTAVSSPKEQIRRWTLIPGDDSNSITFDVTSAQSTDHIVTLDMDLEGLVIPLIWNPTTLTYDNLPFSNTNGIAESQDINGDLTSDLYRLKFQDGGPFDGDTIVNGLVSLNFEIAQLTPIDVPTTGGIVSGTEANDYLNAQLSTGTNRLSGLGGMDVLIGSPQRDVLTGGSGNDRLYGKAGVDQLYGEAGDDILDGGLAMDLLYGGAGADSFVLRAGDGPDRVMDFNAIDGDLFLLDNLTFGALSFQGNRTFLGAELLATVIDNLGLPVTTLGSNPQWFVTT